MSFLGREIQKARIDRGWKQKDLLAVTKLSQRYLSDIEHGKVEPRFGIVVRIADALGISVDRLANAHRAGP